MIVRMSVVLDVRFPPVHSVQQKQTKVGCFNGRLWNCFLQGKKRFKIISFLLINNKCTFPPGWLSVLSI